MPTVTLSRSDLFPVGTTVGIYPQGARNPGFVPKAAVIASAAVDAAGLLTVTDAGIVQGVRYIAYASVSGEHRYCSVRSTLDISDLGRAAGVATTTSGSAALSAVSASSGAFAIGQRITGAGIPAGTYLIAGSGAAWTMSANATASGAGVAVAADGASPAVVPSDKGVGALAAPVSVTTWRAKVMQRRSISGTS